MERWREMAALAIADRSPETRRSYAAAWASWLAYLAPADPRAATRADVLGWLAAGRAAGLSESTLAARLAACSAVWAALGESGRPFTRTGAGLPPEPRWTPVRPMTVRQVCRLLSAIDRTTPAGARDYALLALLWRTGARPAAVLTLRVGDLDLAAGTATTDGAPVVLGAELIAALRAYIDVAWPLRPPDPAEPLFRPLRAGAAGRPISGAQLREMLQRHLSAAGIDDGPYTPESLRLAGRTS